MSTVELEERSKLETMNHELVIAAGQPIVLARSVEVTRPKRRSKQTDRDFKKATLQKEDAPTDTETKEIQ